MRLYLISSLICARQNIAGLLNECSRDDEVIQWFNIQRKKYSSFTSSVVSYFVLFSYLWINTLIPFYSSFIWQYLIINNYSMITVHEALMSCCSC